MTRLPLREQYANLKQKFLNLSKDYELYKKAVKRSVTKEEYKIVIHNVKALREEHNEKSIGEVKNVN